MRAALPDSFKSLQIQTLRPGDLPAVIALHQATFPAYFSTLAGPGYLRKLYGTFITDTDCLALGAIVNGSLVGIATGHGNRRAFNRVLFVHNFPSVATSLAWRFVSHRDFRSKVLQ